MPITLLQPRLRYLNLVDPMCLYARGCTIRWLAWRDVFSFLDTHKQIHLTPNRSLRFIDASIVCGLQLIVAGALRVSEALSCLLLS